MKRHPYFRTLWILVHLSLFASLGLLVYGLSWELSTRKYLEGFSEAVVPLSGSPEEKIEAILEWMEHGPPRRGASEVQEDSRDPHSTLNYSEFLKECGTATNAFINLANSLGLDARRLLLIDENRQVKHVVAEVRVNDRWVVVDPLYRTAFRGPQGQLLTREDLQSPEIFQSVTSKIPNYSPIYNYERTSHVRLARIPYLGRILRRALDSTLPGWEDSVLWSMLLERRSATVTFLGVVLFLMALMTRFVLSWYVEKRLNVARIRFRDQLKRVFVVLFEEPG